MVSPHRVILNDSRRVGSRAAPLFLAIAGNIGSGKTTLTRRLAERLGVAGMYESTGDNPYLADFYEDMRRYALPLQLRFLAARVRDTRDFVSRGASAIQDRTCYEDAEIFAANLHARGEMDDRDFETYQQIARQLFIGLEPPQVLVYLRRSVSSCRSQILTRGRSYEQEMPESYLETLARRYDDWFEHYQRGPKMLVAAEEHDFLHSEEDLEKLVARIVDALPQGILSFS